MDIANSDDDVTDSGGDEQTQTTSTSTSSSSQRSKHSKSNDYPESEGDDDEAATSSSPSTLKDAETDVDLTPASASSSSSSNSATGGDSARSSAAEGDADGSTAIKLEPGDASDSDDDVPNALPPSASSSDAGQQPNGSPRALVQGVVMSDDTDPFVANGKRNSTRQNAPYDNIFKLKVVDWHKANSVSTTKTCERFGVSDRSLRRWLGQEKRLRNGTQSAPGRKPASHTVTTNGTTMPYDTSFKLQVLTWHHRNGQKPRETCEHFAVGEAALRRWLKHEEALRSESTQLQNYKAQISEASPHTQSSRLYDLAFKIRVLDWHNEHRDTPGKTCEHFGVDSNTLLRWRKKEALHRQEAARVAMAPPAPKSSCNRGGAYDRAYKLSVLDWYHEHGRSQKDTCRRCGIVPSTLDRWLEQEESMRDDERKARAQPEAPSSQADRAGGGYDLAYKLQVLDWHHAHGSSKTSTCAHCGIVASTLDRWLKSERALREEHARALTAPAPPSKPQDAGPGYDRAHKLAVLDWHRENGQSQKDTCRKCGIVPSTLDRWIKNEAALREEEAKAQAMPAAPVSSSDGGPIYERDYKLRVLDWHHSNGRSQKDTCHKCGIAPSTLERWLKQETQLRQEAALITPAKPSSRLYDDAFKLQVLNWHHKNGESQVATCDLFKISSNTMKRWLNQELALREAAASKLEESMASSSYRTDKVKTYDRAYKLGVLDWHRANGNSRQATIEHCNIVPSTLDRWLRQEAELREEEAKAQNAPAAPKMQAVKGTGYDRASKLRVLDWYHQHGRSKQNTCDQCGIVSSTLDQWLKKEDSLRKADKENDQEAHPAPKTKYYSTEFKVQVLDWYHANGRIHVKTCDTHDIAPSTLRKWIKTEEQLREEFAETMGRSPGSTAPPVASSSSDDSPDSLKRKYDSHSSSSNKKRRTSAPGLGETFTKPHNRLYALDFKIRVLDYHHEHPKTPGKTCDFFGVDSNTLLRWRKKEHLLRADAQRMGKYSSPGDAAHGGQSSTSPPPFSTPFGGHFQMVPNSGSGGGIAPPPHMMASTGMHSPYPYAYRPQAPYAGVHPMAAAAALPSPDAPHYSKWKRRHGGDDSDNESNADSGSGMSDSDSTDSDSDSSSDSSDGSDSDGSADLDGDDASDSDFDEGGGRRSGKKKAISRKRSRSVTRGQQEQQREREAQPQRNGSGDYERRAAKLPGGGGSSEISSSSPTPSRRRSLSPISVPQRDDLSGSGGPSTSSSSSSSSAPPKTPLIVKFEGRRGGAAGTTPSSAEQQPTATRKTPRRSAGAGILDPYTPAPFGQRRGARGAAAGRNNAKRPKTASDAAANGVATASPSAGTPAATSSARKRPRPSTSPSRSRSTSPVAYVAKRRNLGGTVPSPTKPTGRKRPQQSSGSGGAPTPPFYGGGQRITPDASYASASSRNNNSRNDEHFSLTFKLRVLDYLSDGRGSRTDACREFSVSRDTLRSWMSEEVQLRESDAISRRHYSNSYKLGALDAYRELDRLNIERICEQFGLSQQTFHEWRGAETFLREKQRRATQRPERTFSTEEKQRVLRWYRENESATFQQAADKFDVPPRVLSEWVADTATADVVAVPKPAAAASPPASESDAPPAAVNGVEDSAPSQKDAATPTKTEPKEPAAAAAPKASEREATDTPQESEPAAADTDAKDSSTPPASTSSSEKSASSSASTSSSSEKSTSSSSEKSASSEKSPRKAAKAPTAAAAEESPARRSTRRRSARK